MATLRVDVLKRGGASYVVSWGSAKGRRRRRFPTKAQAEVFFQKIEAGADPYSISPAQGGALNNPQPPDTKIDASLIHPYVARAALAKSWESVRIQLGVRTEVWTCVRHGKGLIPFDMADRILCALGGGRMTWINDEKLEEAYQEVNLAWLDTYYPPDRRWARGGKTT